MHAAVDDVAFADGIGLDEMRIVLWQFFRIAVGSW